jgi:hypothetical protein
MLPVIGLLLLPGCSTPMPKSEPTVTASSNPCRAIMLPDIDQATRQELAAELAAAPAAAVWPDQVGAYVRMRAAVMACRGAAQ